LVGAFALASASGALAASPQSYGVQAPSVQPPTAPLSAAAPLFSIFGLPVALNAPVAAPYCNCAAENFGGQPMRGPEALLAPATGRRQ
jgi:hypothetical protein